MTLKIHTGNLFFKCPLHAKYDVRHDTYFTLFNLHKNSEETHFKAEETQSQRDSVICKAITRSEYLNLHLVGHITNLIFKCNVIIQRDAALNSYFKLFLNYRNHLGACMGYPGPQITFKWSVQVHLEVYSTLI